MARLKTISTYFWSLTGEKLQNKNRPNRSNFNFAHQVASSGYGGPETDGLSPSTINRAMEEELFQSVDTVTPSLDLPLYANPPLRQLRY